MQSLKFYLMIYFSLLVLISGDAEAAERAKANVKCEKTDIQFAYDCHIRLIGKKSGKPIEGAKFEVGADMSSMPMTHNIKPVMAIPGKKPGHLPSAYSTGDVWGMGLENRPERTDA